MLSHLAVIAEPLFLLGLAALVAWLVPLIRRHVRSKLAADALAALVAIAATLVRDAEQTIVSALKDPTSPGVWTPDLAAKVKATVVSDLYGLGHGPITDLMATGLDPARIETLLSRVVESQVLDLHQRAPQMLTNVGTLSVAAPETASAR